jgi:putative FmdB family regulatory protein
MPLYPYTCAACGHGFEALVTSSAATATAVVCPECESDNVNRRIGLPARPKAVESTPVTNCRGDGPPCGAAWCGRGKG